MEDPGFQEQLAAVQKKKLLSDKEADFRQYLVRSGGAEELVKLLWDLTPPRERPFVKPNLGDANFIMEQCNDNGNVAYLSRDELKDAVLLWRRIEKSTRPSPTDRSRTGRQLGACCLKLCCG